MDISTCVLAAAVYMLGQCVTPGEENDHLVRKLIDAESPREAAIACSELFDRSIQAAHQPSQLMASKSPTIAIHAAWRLHSRIVPPKQPRFGISAIIRHKPDIQRFVGFLEGRLRIAVPFWWEEMLESPDKLHPLRQSVTTTALLVVDETPVEELATRAICTLDGRRLAVPAATFRWLVGSSDAPKLSAAACETHLVILALGEPFDDDERYRITCLSLTEGLELWRNSVWGTRQSLSVSVGLPVERINTVTISVDDEHVTVFGAQSDRRDGTEHTEYLNSEFFVEQFDTRSGQIVVRFSTNNWGVTVNSCD